MARHTPQSLKTTRHLQEQSRMVREALKKPTAKAKKASPLKHQNRSADAHKL
jgi:hypothetical protein